MALPYLRDQSFAQVEEAYVEIWTSTLSGDKRIQRSPSEENRDYLGSYAHRDYPESWTGTTYGAPPKTCTKTSASPLGALGTRLSEREVKVTMLPSVEIDGLKLK
jgi:hypothetical protein